jgi:uncharacterized membrane protein
MNKTRFEAFSDGVFAFAITLLVLGIGLPELTQLPPTDAELSRALLHLWPRVLAYLLSFAVIGVMWQNHHALFRLIPSVDRTTVLLNLLLLCVTAFIPFVTSTLGAYPTTRSATFLYGLTLTSASTVYNLILRHLARSNAFSAEVSAATIHQTVIAYRVGWGTYTVATLTSLVEPLLSLALYLLVVAYYLIPRGADNDLGNPSARRGQTHSTLARKLGSPGT